jgi:hypothetical protein
MYKGSTSPEHFLHAMILCVNEGYFFPKRALRIERYYFDLRMSDERRKFDRHKGAHD